MNTAAKYNAYKNSVNAEACERWSNGPRVRLDSLRAGDAFESITGDRWSVVRPYGSGAAIICLHSDGKSTDYFCANAEVVRAI